MTSLSIRPSYGARGEEILDGGGGTSLPFSLPFFPFSPETPDTQASCDGHFSSGKISLEKGLNSRKSTVKFFL